MFFVEIAGAGFVALLLAFLITPFIRHIARSLGVVRKPGGRHKHAKSTSLLGGIGLIVTTILLVVLHPTLVLTPQILGILMGLAIILVVGVVDDMYDTRWPVQLIGQIFAASVLLLSGITLPLLHNPFGGIIDLSSVPYVGGALLIVWMVLVMNAINWLDGADGIATSVSIAALVTLIGVALLPQVLQPPLAIIAAIGAGAAVGFLLWNRPPASIFLGSAGSFGLGFLIAALAVLAGAKIATAAIVLLIPIADFTAVLLSRAKAGVSLARGDRRHLHFRLRARGVAPVQLFLLYGGSALFLGALALFVPQPLKGGMLVVIYVVLVVTLLRLAPAADEGGE